MRDLALGGEDAGVVDGVGGDGEQVDRLHWPAAAAGPSGPAAAGPRPAGPSGPPRTRSGASASARRRCGPRLPVALGEARGSRSAACAARARRRRRTGACAPPTGGPRTRTPTCARKARLDLGRACVQRRGRGGRPRCAGRRRGRGGQISGGDGRAVRSISPSGRRLLRTITTPTPASTEHQPAPAEQFHQAELADDLPAPPPCPTATTRLPPSCSGIARPATRRRRTTGCAAPAARPPAPAVPSTSTPRAGRRSCRPVAEYQPGVGPAAACRLRRRRSPGLRRRSAVVDGYVDLAVDRGRSGSRA